MRGKDREVRSLAGKFGTQLGLHEIEFGKRIAHASQSPSIKLHRARTQRNLQSDGATRHGADCSELAMPHYTEHLPDAVAQPDFKRYRE
jgi:hypothetical protein